MSQVFNCEFKTNDPDLGIRILRSRHKWLFGSSLPFVDHWANTTPSVGTQPAFTLRSADGTMRDAIMTYHSSVSWCASKTLCFKSSHFTEQWVVSYNNKTCKELLPIMGNFLVFYNQFSFFNIKWSQAVLPGPWGSSQPMCFQSAITKL